MKKKKKGIYIYIWILIWAGLLISVLHSPVGTPDLYSFHNYYTLDQFAQTPGRRILNATKGKAANENNDFAINLPDFNSESVTKSNNDQSDFQSLYASSRISSYNSHSQLTQSSSGSDGISGLGTSNIASRWSRNSEGSSGIEMVNGITTMSFSTNLSNNTIKQSVMNGYIDSPGGTNPGGDPLDPAIPVGDGWGLLIFFGVCYTAFKKRFSIKRQL